VNCLNVFQIYLSDVDEIPPGVRACMQSVRAATPGYQYRLYDLASLRSFIQEHFPPDVLHAYDALRPYAYRADLG
jgi:mannosyltransferase OCH1-like enzyme